MASSSVGTTIRIVTRELDRTYPIIFFVSFIFGRRERADLLHKPKNLKESRMKIEITTTKIKRQADIIVKKTGVKLKPDGLDLAAQLNGFKHWHEAEKVLSKEWKR